MGIIISTYTPKIRIRITPLPCFPSGNKGFSVLEMMIVAIIMAILAAIAIPFYSESLVDAYAPEGEAVLAAISTAAQRYRLENGNSFVGMNLNAVSDTKSLLRLGLDMNTTNKWTFSLSGLSATTFATTATGTNVVPDVQGKTIVLTYNINNAPHETKSYSW